MSTLACSRDFQIFELTAARHPGFLNTQILMADRMNGVTMYITPNVTATGRTVAEI